MSINNLGELRTWVNNKLAKTYADARIDEWIELAEAHMVRELKIREVETTSTTLSLTGGTRGVSLPSDYRGFRSIYLTTNPVQPLEYLTPMDFWRRRGANEQAQPDFFTIEGETVQFGPIPGDNYTANLTYYSTFALSDASPTNSILTNHPDCYQYGTLKHGYEFKEAFPQATYYMGEFQRVINSMKKADSIDRHGPAPLRIITDVGNP